MPYSPAGVPFKWRIPPGSYKEHFAQAGNESEIRLGVDWYYADLLRSDMLASASHVVGRSYLTRRNPYKNPVVGADTGNGQYAVGFRLTGVDTAPSGRYPFNSATGPFTHTYAPTAQDWPVWAHAEYAVTFQNLPYLVQKDADVYSLTSPELNRYASVMAEQVPYNRIVPGWAIVTDEPNPVAVLQSGAIPEIHTRYTVRLWWWPYPAALPWSVWDAKTGKVNSDSVTLTPISKTFGPGVLRFDGVRFAHPEPYDGADGRKYCDPILVLYFNPTGWNKYRDPKTGTVKDLKINGSVGPQRPFETTTLTEIFNPR